MFEHYFQDPVRAANFAGFTRAMSKTGDRDPKFLVDGFNWAAVKTLEDVSLIKTESVPLSWANSVMERLAVAWICVGCYS